MLNEMINNLHFIRPYFLWALPVLLLIIWLLQRKTAGDDGWSKICDPHLLDAIKIKSASKGSYWKHLLWPIAIIAVLAIAGPAFRKMPTPVIKNQSALVIALDVSKSMLSDDVKPNRLERAKYKINDILQQRKDGQTALVVYSGDAFVVTPLTDDTQTVALMLKAIHPDIMPVQGSRADIALNKAASLLQQAGYISGDILLISDGVNLTKAQNTVKNLAKNHIKTSVLAVGTKKGAPIKTKSGFIKDKAGNIVIPKLEVNKLQKLAQTGKGRFAEITGDSADINYLLPKVNNNDKDQDPEVKKEDAFDTEKYIDEGPWLTLLLIPLMLLLFRKGVLLVLFLAVSIQMPSPSYAFTWDDLWLNSDQKAAKQIGSGEAKEAFNTAKSDDWKAKAAYKNKDYQEAKKLFNNKTEDGYYNKGNSLALSGELDKAIKAYDEALKINPKNEDAIYNKKQVEQALEKQKEQEKDKQDKDNKDKKDQDKKDKDQQNKDDSQKQDEDQEQKDGEKDQDQENQDSKDGQKNQDKQDNPDQKEKEEKSKEMTEEEKKAQEEKKKQLEKADKKEKEQQEKEQKEVKLSPEKMAENAENKEAIEQWLRRIPDDPGGLLRRKFYYQYNQQNKKPDETDDW